MPRPKNSEKTKPVEKVEKAKTLEKARTVTVITGTSPYLQQLREPERSLSIEDDSSYDGFVLLRLPGEESEAPLLIALAQDGVPSVQETIEKAVLTQSRAIYLSNPPIPEPVCFFTHDIDIVAVSSLEEGANYVQYAVKAFADNRKSQQSRWHHKGPSCRSLNRTTTSTSYVTWISMLMEIPMMSEESAKAIAERYPTPREIVDACTSCGNDLLFADIEMPCRGQKTVRRIGPQMSKKLFQIFTATDPDQHIC